MNFLVISPNTGLPANNGSRRRIYHTLVELSRNNQVSFTALLQETEDAAFLDALSAICDQIQVFPWKKRSKSWTAAASLLNGNPYRVNRFKEQRMKTFLSGYLSENQFDVIWVHFLELLWFLPEDTGDALVVVDYHNDDFAMWERTARNSESILQRLFAAINLKFLEKFNYRYSSRIDVGLTVSPEDLKSSQSWQSKDADLWLVPNGVDLDYFSGKRNPSPTPLILFCGALDIEMNIEALRYFAARIFPEIWDRVENVRFHIVGRDPDQRVYDLGTHPGIDIYPSVPDVRPYYEEAWLAVSPYRLGGGSKLKVLEAMAMRVPVVATPIGSQGIQAENGRNIVIAESEEDFSTAVIDLIADKARRAALAEEGRALIEKDYSWESIVNDTMDRLHSLLPGNEGETIGSQL